MEDQNKFRSRCEALFADVASQAANVISWRLLARSNSEGGPTFEVKLTDGSVRRHVVPDFHIVTAESDGTITAQIRDFLGLA